MFGITDASPMRIPSTPWTRPAASTTAPRPHVPTGWWYVSTRARAAERVRAQRQVRPRSRRSEIRQGGADANAIPRVHRRDSGADRAQTVVVVDERMTCRNGSIERRALHRTRFAGHCWLSALTSLRERGLTAPATGSPSQFEERTTASGRPRPESTCDCGDKARLREPILAPDQSAAQTWTPPPSPCRSPAAPQRDARAPGTPLAARHSSPPKLPRVLHEWRELAAPVV